MEAEMEWAQLNEIMKLKTTINEHNPAKIWLYEPKRGKSWNLGKEKLNILHNEVNSKIIEILSEKSFQT